MSADFSALGDLAKQTPTQIKKGWAPPTADDLAYGTVIAIDQSLSHTGWVVLSHLGDEVKINNAGTIDPTFPLLTGMRLDLEKSKAIYDGVAAIPWIVSPDADLVGETPPPPGRVKGNAQSSIMSAVSVTLVGHHARKEVTWYAASTWKSTVSGQTKDKKLAHEAMREHCFGWITGTEVITNEAKRDALGIAITHLKKMKDAQ